MQDDQLGEATNPRTLLLTIVRRQQPDRQDERESGDLDKLERGLLRHHETPERRRGDEPRRLAWRLWLTRAPYLGSWGRQTGAPTALLTTL